MLSTRFSRRALASAEFCRQFFPRREGHHRHIITRGSVSFPRKSVCRHPLEGACAEVPPRGMRHPRGRPFLRAERSRGAVDRRARPSSSGSTGGSPAARVRPAGGSGPARHDRRPVSTVSTVTRNRGFARPAVILRLDRRIPRPRAGAWGRGIARSSRAMTGAGEPRVARRRPAGRATRQAGRRSGGVASAASVRTASSRGSASVRLSPSRRRVTVRSSTSRPPIARIAGTLASECSRTL